MIAGDENPAVKTQARPKLASQKEKRAAVLSSITAQTKNRKQPSLPGVTAAAVPVQTRELLGKSPAAIAE